jgi:hypothetical protein
MTTQTIAEYYCERCGSAVEVDVGRARRGSKPGGGILTKLLGGGSSDGTYELTVGGTYMLCFGCRQYVCAHCWNEAESRCRTCSPASDGCDALPAPPPFAVPAAEMAEAPKAAPPGPWPESDLRRRAAEPRPTQVELEPIGAEPEALEPEALEPQSATIEPGAPDLVAAGDTEEVALAEAPALIDAAEPDASGVAVDLPAAVEAVEASEPVPTEAEPAAAEEQVTAEPTTAAAVHQPRVHRSLRIRSKRVVRRARAVQPPITAPGTVAPALALPFFVEPAAELRSLEPVVESVLPPAPEPVLEAEPEQQAEPDQQIVAPEPVEAIVLPEEPPARPYRRRGSQDVRPTETGSAPQAEEPAAAHDVRAEPEAPIAAEPPSAPEPLPAPVVPTRDGIPALPEGWRLVAGEAGPPQPPAPPAALTDAAVGWPAREWPQAPTTTPPSTGLPLGIVQRIAAESQHRIAAAWAPRMASQDHRGPQIHGCVSCALPLSATARFCRRCGSPQA